MKWDHIGLNQTNFTSLPDGGLAQTKHVSGSASLAKVYGQKQVSRQGNSTAYNSKENAPNANFNNQMSEIFMQQQNGVIWMNNSTGTAIGPDQLDDDQSRSLSNLMTPM